MTTAPWRTGRRRVLILDDDPLVAQIVAFVADDAGFDSQLVPNPAQLLIAIDAWQPTHIVLVVTVPDMDGVRILRRLAARGCGARVIVISRVGTSAVDDIRREAIDLGLDIAGVLSKPFRSGERAALLLAGPESARM
jgi:DNA-binding response OmpR family regulator